MTHSLRNRLLSYTVAIIVAVSGGIAFYPTVETRKDLLAGFQRDREAHGRQMAAELAGNLQDHNLRALDGQLRAAYASPGVLYIRLLDAEGGPLRPLSAAAHTGAESSLFERQLVAGGRSVSVVTPDRLTVGGPIVMPDGKRVGFIQIGFSLDNIDGAIHRLTRATFLAVVFCLLGGVAMAFLLARTITVPLGQLTATVHAIGAGALHARVPARRADEVGVLADAINQAAARLEVNFKSANEAEAEARRLNQELEARIAARTAELAAVNGRLQIELIERRAAEEARSESEERFRRLADGAPVLIWMSGPDKRLFYTNQHWLDYTGRTLVDEINDSWRSILHAQDSDRWFQAYDEAFAARRPFMVEHRLRRADGAYRWFLSKGIPNLTPSGILAGYLGSSVDVTDLKESELALRQAEGRQRELVESLKAIVWETETLTWKFSFVSLGAETILGYPIARWYQEPHFWANIIHPEDRAGTLATCQSLTAEGKDHELEYRVVAADGSVVWLRDLIRVIKDESGRPVRRGGVKIDISPLKRIEEALQESLKGLLFLQEISQLIMTAADPETVLSEILRRCVAYGEFDLGTILLLGADGESLLTAAAHGYRDPANAERRPKRELPQPEPRYRSLDYQRTMIVEDIENGSGFRPLKNEGMTTALIVPIGSGSGALGFLQLASRKKKKIDARLIQIAEAIVHQIGISIQKERLEEETRNNLARIRALYDINLSVTSSLDLNEVLTTLMERVTVALGYSVATVIRLVDKSTSRLEVAASLNLPKEDLVAHDRSGKQPFAAIVAARKQAVFIADVQHHPDCPDPEFYRKHGVISLIGVPLMVRGEVLGTLVVNTRESRDIGKDDVDFVTMLGAQAAMAIHNARLYREIREQKAAIEKAKEIETAAAAKSRFLAMVSHEIRTPLNAVIGLTGLLLETELSADQRKMTATVKQSGEGLLVIINDLLDYSKIEADKLAIEDTEFDLRKAMSEVVDIMLPQARSKGLTLTYTYPPNVPDVISGDAGRVRQVLLNLLSNAVKFTGRGEVALRVEVAKDRGDEVLLGFKVKDSGIGIPAELQQRLFQPFSQGDSSSTRRFGGTGLGLAICKRLVELMGGVIGMESAEGKGSVFWFTMLTRRGSRAAAAGPDRAQLPPVMQHKKSNGGRVLLVEDNMANQMVATLLLEKMGYLSDVAANGVEALDAIGRVSYDIILMDCDMPQMDGFQATQAMRKRERGTGAHVPIIAMTANAMQGDRERCLAAGMDDYLTKPISQEDLKAAFDQWQ